MLYVFIFLLWKIVKKSKFVRAAEMDITTGLDEVEAHESSLDLKAPVSRYDRYVTKFIRGNPL